jgi:hypothetical protein
MKMKLKFRCRFAGCEEAFGGKKERKEHEFWHNQSPTSHLPPLPFPLLGVDVFLARQETKKRLSQIKCKMDGCNAGYASQSALNRHYHKAHPGALVKCSDCRRNCLVSVLHECPGRRPKQTPTPEIREQPLMCGYPFCNFIFFSRLERNIHEFVLHSNNCVVCHISCIDKPSLKHHFALEHSQLQVYVCHRCGTNFPTSSERKKHVYVCRGKRATVATADVTQLKPKQEDESSSFSTDSFFQ